MISGSLVGSGFLMLFGAATFIECVATGRIPNSAMRKVTRENRPKDFWIAACGFGLLAIVGLVGVIGELL